MIYLYGDSHARSSFKGITSPHECRAESSVTMYRIGRDKSIVNWKPCNPDDTVILAYGEVDCRAHIGKQVDLGRTEDEVIQELTNAYIDTVRSVARCHVIIVAVIPPTTNAEYCRENPDGGFPFVSSDVDRVRYTRKVNETLKSLCRQNKFVFFTPYDPYTREDGCLRRELSDGNVHIGNTAHILSHLRPAFIIPVYPNDYGRLTWLQNLPQLREFDIILVLTYRSDLQTLYVSNVTSVLVLEDFLTMQQIEIVARKNIFAIVKTYFALQTLKTRYTYFACVDCEIAFKNCTSMYAKFAKRYDDHIIVGSTLDVRVSDTHAYNTVITINRSSACYFSDEEIVTLSRLTNEFQLYSWFSDIPIYHSDTIDEFLKCIGFQDIDTWLSKTTSNFHSIPYSYYLLLRKNHRVLDVKTLGIQREWSLECMPLQTYEKVCKTGYIPLWVVNEIYDSSMSNCVLTYHCDRKAYFFGSD
jgi:hypothetical protein